MFSIDENRNNILDVYTISFKSDNKHFNYLENQIDLLNKEINTIYSKKDELLIKLCTTDNNNDAKIVTSWYTPLNIDDIRRILTSVILMNQLIYRSISDKSSVRYNLTIPFYSWIIDFLEVTITVNMDNKNTNNLNSVSEIIQFNYIDKIGNDKIKIIMVTDCTMIFNIFNLDLAHIVKLIVNIDNACNDNNVDILYSFLDSKNI